MTKQPYEIVVSISIPKNEKIADYITVIESCRDIYPHIRLNISLMPLTAAQNRNLAASLTKGDIIISLDADDIYHPQLLEIVYDVWKKYPDTVEFHWICTINEVKIKKLKFNEIKIYKSTDYCHKGIAEKYYIYDNFEYYSIAHGHGAYAKEVLDEIKWPELIWNEDISHNRLIIRKYTDRSIFIWEALTFYIMTNSIGLTNF